MKRYYFRWVDPLSGREMLSRFIADDFEEAMGFVKKNIGKYNGDLKTNLALSDFTFLKEEDETRPWVNKGLDPTGW